MPAPRRLLARLRETLAQDAPALATLVPIIARELEAEACSVYVMRPGEILELIATDGLNPSAIGLTRLRVGEGIVGLSAAMNQILNLPDAQNHPAFAYRPETGEEPFAALLVVPVRRAGRILGALTVQNRQARLFSEDEVEVLETVAMLLAEILAAAGAFGGAREGLGSTLPRIFAGNVLAPGGAIGPVVIHGPRYAARRLLADDPEAELSRLQVAADQMRRGLHDLIESRAPDGRDGANAAASREVLDAYKMVAADPGWMRRVAEVISVGLSAEAAVQRVAADMRDRMRRIADPYLRERLADLEDVAGRLLRELGGETCEPPVPPGAILLARRLGPAELLAWHARGIAGLAIEDASPSGHAAILARALELPALAGARGALDAAEAGEEVLLDADGGQLVLRPEAEVKESYQYAFELRSERQAAWAALRGQESRTADGVRVRLMLNVGLNLELDQLGATGADGIGLFRTEIAMLARGAVTGAAEQAAIYGRVLDAVGDRPVLFRTLDLGGDKLLPGMEREGENPAMGWRSIRVGLDRPSLLRTQIRALLLAAAGRPLSIMFPMVATVAEFRAARALAMAELNRVALPPASLSIGTMLEVPALLWQLPALLKITDFISVGSNDLLQFLFAADRNTPAIAGRYDFLSPAMLDVLETVVAAAHGAGVPLSLCGEAAARPLEALVSVALGIDTLSMPASGLLPIKALLAAVDIAAFRSVLQTVRRSGAAEANLRETLMAWAREQNLPV